MEFTDRNILYSTVIANSCLQRLYSYLSAQSCFELRWKNRHEHMHGHEHTVDMSAPYPPNVRVLVHVIFIVQSAKFQQFK
jgi:hypothetical protein